MDLRGSQWVFSFRFAFTETSVQAVCLCGARKASAWGGASLVRVHRSGLSTETVDIVDLLNVARRVFPASTPFAYTAYTPGPRLMNFAVRKRTSYNAYDTRTQSGLANRFYPHLSFMSKDTTDLSSGQNTDDIRKVSHNLNGDHSS